MTVVLAPFQPRRFAITQWHADVELQRLDSLDENQLRQGLSWSLHLAMRPTPLQHDNILAAQVELRLESKWRDALDNETELESSDKHEPLSLNTTIVGVFTYTFAEDVEVAQAVETFVEFLRRNGTAYLYSALRPEVRSYFLNSINRQILLPAINTAEAFKNVQISLSSWADFFQAARENA